MLIEANFSVDDDQIDAIAQANSDLLRSPDLKAHFYGVFKNKAETRCFLAGLYQMRYGETIGEKELEERMVGIPPLCVATGRMKTVLLHPERGTLDPSCTLYLYDNNLEETILFVEAALRYSAGVKVHLEKFVERPPVPPVQFGLYLDPNHPDFKYLSPEQRSLSSVVHGTWIHVADSMESSDNASRPSIRDSWLLFIRCLMRGEPVVVDLSRLRPAGRKNSRGLIASGPASFAEIYRAIANHLAKRDIISLMQLLGELCKQLRRGGVDKNGIVCFGLHYKHPDIERFLECPLSDLPGGQKKGFRYAPDVHDNPKLEALVVQKLNEGGLFLEKIVSDILLSNVCVEILQKPKGVCLLSSINAGKCRKPTDLIEAFVSVAEFVCHRHITWRDRAGYKAKMYLPLEEDRQIGVSITGWANFLRIQGVTYLEHVEALEAYLDGKPYHGNKVATEIADCLIQAYIKATQRVEKMMEPYGGIDRIWTIKPDQRVWVDYQDLDGYTLCRNIDPPFERFEYRDSHTDLSSVGQYDHGPVEIASEVGHELHDRQWEAFQRVMNLTGKAHTMSFDWWKPVTVEDFRAFTASNKITSYYQSFHHLDQNYLNKGFLVEAFDDETCNLEEGCSSCAD
jgi:hypothetical protein